MSIAMPACTVTCTSIAMVAATDATMHEVTAGTTESAEHILRGLVGPPTGRIFWDIPGPNTAAQTLAKQLGFHPVRDLTRMKFGQMLTTPDISMQFGIAAPETG